MATLEEQNVIEDNETQKVIPENIAEKNLSQEELFDFANNEEQKFKQETTDEKSKLNSINIDEPTFEKIKNEIGVEQDLNHINTESEIVINEAKEQIKDNQQKTMAEMRAPNITKILQETFSNEQDFSEANRIALKINNLIDFFPEEKQKVASEKLRGLLDNNNLYLYKELHDEILEEKKDFERMNQGVENKSFVNVKDFDELIKQVEMMGGVQGSNEFFTPDMIKDVIQKVRSKERGIDAITSTGGLRQKVSQLLVEPNPMNAQLYSDDGRIYSNKKTDEVELSIPSIEQSKETNQAFVVQESLYTNSLISTPEKIIEHWSKSPEERRKIVNEYFDGIHNRTNQVKNLEVEEKPEKSIIEDEGRNEKQNFENFTNEKIVVQEQKELVVPSVEEIVSQHFLYKDTVPERSEANEQWARNENGELKENMRNYAEAYQSMLTESAEKLGLLKRQIRENYNKIMNAIGVLSSIYGQSETWIDWDLSKQKYLSEHPEVSNKNYKLADPFSVENQEITKNIVDRHVGWEFLGYVIHNPDFLNSLDKSDDTYVHIKELVNEGISLREQRKDLPSYKLSELGKLIQQNKKIYEPKF